MVKKRKIIVVSTVGLIYDGITSVVLSYLQAMDLEKIQVYVVSTIKCEKTIKKHFEDLGCHIVELPSRREQTLKYLIDLIRFIRANRIEVIHAHGNSATLTIEMLAGILGGCKKRIAHSHNTQCTQVKADKLLRPLFYLLYTDAFACGEDAGKWLFRGKPFKVLKNGRNLKKFSYNEKLRYQMREKYGFSSELVLGHVGGFYAQKNHEFVLKIFQNIIEMEPNAKCFFIGDGPLKEEIEEKASNYRNNIFFTGTTDNVTAYLNMMDGMVLPSLFEGLPLVTLEWQINGLPCILADTITKQCAVVNTVEFMSLNISPKKWAEEIIKLTKMNNRAENSISGQNKVRKAGYDIYENAKLLEQEYLK